MNPLVSLDDFCRGERPRLVGSLTVYCGDREQAEEIAQDALARACDRWDEVRRMDAPGAWLHRVARNLTSSHYRRQRIRRRIYEQVVEPDSWQTDPDTPTVVAVRRALELLPARQRAAITLRYLDDWAVADVARVLDTTDDAVKSLTYRGLNTLREHLASDDAREGVHRAAGLLTLVLVAATIAVANWLAAPAEPIYVDPAPPPIPEVPPDAWWANSTATIDGAHTDTLRLTDLIIARTDDPMSGEPLDRLDITLRAPGEAVVTVRGEIDQVVTTGGEFEVNLVHGGIFYESVSDECSGTITHFGPRPDATASSYLITGSVRCRDLLSVDGGPPVDLHVAINHELGPQPRHTIER